MFDKTSDNLLFLCDSDKLHTFSVSGSLLCQLLEFRFSRQNGLWVVMNKKQGKVSHFEYYFLSS